MEIIYLVFLVFSGNNLDQVHLEAWHNYSRGPKFLINRPCEDTIKDPAFQAHLKKTLKPGQKGKLLCRTYSEVDSITSLSNAPGVDLLPASRQKPEASDSDASILEGKLVHRPYEEGRKSVEAYLGQEFFLQQEDGEEVAIYPGKEFSRNALIKLKNQKIRIRTRFVDRTPKVDPAQPMSYPMESDGSPMRRTGYELIELNPQE